jgi:hypothetical protein
MFAHAHVFLPDVMICSIIWDLTTSYRMKRARAEDMNRPSGVRPGDFVLDVVDGSSGMDLGKMSAGIFCRDRPTPSRAVATHQPSQVGTSQNVPKQCCLHLNQW